MCYCVDGSCDIQGDHVDAVKTNEVQREIAIIKNQIKKAYKDGEPSTAYRISRHKKDFEFWESVANELVREGYTVSSEIDFLTEDIATMLIHWKGAGKRAKQTKHSSESKAQ